MTELTPTVPTDTSYRKKPLSFTRNVTAVHASRNAFVDELPKVSETTITIQEKNSATESVDH